MKRNPANKASLRQTLLRVARKKGERKVESRRKQRAHQLEVYANPNIGARPIYTAPRMNGNFRPDSWVMQYHNRVRKGKIKKVTLTRDSKGKAVAQMIGAPVERHA